MKARCQFTKTNLPVLPLHPKRHSAISPCKNRKIQILCLCCAWFSRPRRCAWCCEMPVAGRPEPSHARPMPRGRPFRLARVYLERGRPRKIQFSFWKTRLNLSISNFVLFLFGGPTRIFETHLQQKPGPVTLVQPGCCHEIGQVKGLQIGHDLFIVSEIGTCRSVETKRTPGDVECNQQRQLKLSECFMALMGSWWKIQRCFSFNLVKCAWIFPIVCMLCK